MAQIGIGTNLRSYKQETIDQLLEVIGKGIKMGYKFIDTEDLINEKTQKIFQMLTRYKRSSLFISTRLYDYTPENDFILRIGSLKYIDLCNFGNPPITNSGMVFKTVCLKIWSSMILLKESKLVKHLGIINFHYTQAKKFLALCKSKELELPTVAYLELHPLNMQEDLVKLYQDHKIHIVAFSPLGSNGNHIYSEHKVIDEIGRELGTKDFAQTIIATTMSRGISVVVKSLVPEHLESNLQASKFVEKVTEKHLELLAEINMDSPFNNDTTNAIGASNRLQ